MLVEIQIMQKEVKNNKKQGLNEDKYEIKQDDVSNKTIEVSATNILQLL